ncbi:MAG TPA: 2-oxoacid:ferredoxin oxidoreductase subunit gamma [Proteobacteria bacterium]|nr:pyruvate synthase subunit PorC [bacterium BMS3Abin14]HDL53227.1 2-oxoacid:ferredoxin oxidoreductase subunit gamma [Pseudomonadota bacterium]
MADRFEVRLSGAGGQGLILGGVILAEAASLFEGKNAVQTQSYGPEARGGASKSEVILSEGEVDYPKATEIDLLLCLTQEACDKYTVDLKDNGVLITDSRMVQDIPEGKFKVYQLPIIDTAKDKVGKVFVANIVALGAITRLIEQVSFDSVEKAVLNRVPNGTEDLNKRALKLGYDLVN